MIHDLDELHRLADLNGLTVREVAPGHFHVFGRGLLVNWWPFSKNRTAHVARTRVSRKMVTPLEVVRMAIMAPPIIGSCKRKGSYCRHKRWLLKRDPRCRWCTCELTEETATIEHVIPLARGGLDNRNNYALACKPCNSIRGSDMPELQQTLTG